MRDAGKDGEIYLRIHYSPDGTPMAEEIVNGEKRSRPISDDEVASLLGEPVARDIFRRVPAPLTNALLSPRTAPRGHAVTMPSGAVYGVDPNGTQLWRLDKQRHLTKKQRRAARLAAAAKQVVTGGST